MSVKRRVDPDTGTEAKGFIVEPSERPMVRETRIVMLYEPSGWQYSGYGGSYTTTVARKTESINADIEAANREGFELADAQPHASVLVFERAKDRPLPEVDEDYEAARADSMPGSAVR